MQNLSLFLAAISVFAPALCMGGLRTAPEQLVKFAPRLAE
jgi:hypothetical protein